MSKKVLLTGLFCLSMLTGCGQPSDSSTTTVTTETPAPEAAAPAPMPVEPVVSPSEAPAAPVAPSADANQTNPPAAQ